MPPVRNANAAPAHFRAVCLRAIRCYRLLKNKLGHEISRLFSGRLSRLPKLRTTAWAMTDIKCTSSGTCLKQRPLEAPADLKEERRRRRAARRMKRRQAQANGDCMCQGFHTIDPVPYPGLESMRSDGQVIRCPVCMGYEKAFRDKEMVDGYMNGDICRNTYRKRMLARTVASAFSGMACHQNPYSLLLVSLTR